MIPYYCHNNSEEFYLICTIFLVTFCGGKEKSAMTLLELLFCVFLIALCLEKGNCAKTLSELLLWQEW